MLKCCANLISWIKIYKGTFKYHMTFFLAILDYDDILTFSANPLLSYDVFSQSLPPVYRKQSKRSCELNFSATIKLI